MDKSFLDNCTTFSKLEKEDLKELLFYIKNNKIKYRDSLGLVPNITFGVEIEYEDYKKKYVDRFINKYFDEWFSKEDGSLDSGGEVTSPVMIDDKLFWNDLKVICKYLRRRFVNTSKNAGGHIHIGADILGNDLDAWRIFLKLYTVYEFIIFRFSLGDKVKERAQQDVYARAMSSVLPYYIDKFQKIKNIYMLDKCLPLDNKNYAVNFRNVNLSKLNENRYGNTIEFRGPNATVNEVIWQNNINTFVKMLLAAKEKKLDEYYLDYRLKNNLLNYDYNKFLYNSVNLDDALEFADFIFDNNLDKIYFLTQYLKNFQCNQKNQNIIFAKRFTKK